jgi:hypothetical protein
MAAGAYSRSYSPQGRQETKGKTGTGPGITFEVMTPVTSSSLASPPKVSTTSQNSTISWGPQIQHMNLWVTFHIQTLNSHKSDKNPLE